MKNPLKNFLSILNWKCKTSPNWASEKVWDIMSMKDNNSIASYLVNGFKVTPLIWEANKKNWVEIILIDWWVSSSSFPKKLIRLWKDKLTLDEKKTLGFNEACSD